MITLYLAKAWYPRKKPLLQIKIMELLATKGMMSKSQAAKLLPDHHYPEIHQAYEGLSEKGRIEIARGPFQIKRGKREIFYRISEVGAKALVEVTEDTTRFGNIIIGYCLNQERGVGSEVKELFSIFLGKYLKYPTIQYAYLLNLDPVNDMCLKWIEDYGPSSNKVSVAQKVLEALVLSPDITLRELVKKAASTRQDVEIVLSKFVFDFGMEMAVGELFLHATFLQHCMIVQSPNKAGIQSYRLSLVGVLVVLTLLRHARGSLFHKEYSVKQYYASIARNYSDLLPLIFGKWKLLAQISDPMPVINLDIILSKELRSGSKEHPFALGGNREYYFAIESIVLQNESKLREVEGPLVQLLNQASQSHGPVDRAPMPIDSKLGPIVDELMTINHSLNPYYLNLRSITSGNMKDFERILGNEISFLYYLSLSRDFLGPPVDPTSNRGFHGNPQRLLTILRSILGDPEVAEWFSARLHDIENYYQESIDAIKELSKIATRKP